MGNVLVFEVNNSTRRFLERENNACWSCKTPISDGDLVVSKRAYSGQNHWCVGCALDKRLLSLPFTVTRRDGTQFVKEIIRTDTRKK
jgi:hypothetical protein